MFTIPDIQINVGSVKVSHISGTSSFVIGKARTYDPMSNSKENNGAGNAYGDCSDIDMNPYHSPLYDQDTNDHTIKKEDYPAHKQTPVLNKQPYNPHPYPQIPYGNRRRP